MTQTRSALGKVIIPELNGDAVNISVLVRCNEMRCERETGSTKKKKVKIKEVKVCGHTK